MNEKDIDDIEEHSHIEHSDPKDKEEQKRQIAIDLKTLDKKIPPKNLTSSKDLIQ